MFYYEGKPIFICGCGRSGTYMTGEILQKSPNIVITSEVWFMPQLAALVRRMDERTHNPNWKSQREFFAAGALLDASADALRDRAPYAKRFGNRTPLLELIMDDVRTLFPDARFIYCLRSPFLVLRSFKNMPWNRVSVRDNLERYKKSVRAFRSAEPTPFLVQIDQISDVTGQGRLCRDLFDFIEEPPPDEIAEFAGERWKPANKVIRTALEPLSDEEMELILSDAECMQICEEFGYPQDARDVA